MRNRHGFTLIEVVLTVTILAILAVYALPAFVDIRGNAETASERAIASAVTDGLSLYWANQAVNSPTAQGSYPPALDALAPGTTCSSATPCFSTVVTYGITQDKWKKTADNQYTITTPEGSSVYTYDSGTGRFLK